MAYNLTALASYALGHDGLGSNQARSGPAVTIDVSKNTIDVIFQIRLKLSGTTPSGNRQFVVYAYGSLDGTTPPYGGATATVDNVDGTEKSLAGIGSPSLLLPVFVIPCIVDLAGQTITTQPFGVRSAFPIGLPPKVGIVLHNQIGTGLAGDGTANVAWVRQAYYDNT